MVMVVVVVGWPPSVSHTHLHVPIHQPNQTNQQTALKKVTGKDPLLKKLHSICFGKPGKALEVKVIKRGYGVVWTD